MINLSIPFQKNDKADILEQAAGFPPYTRGYTTISKSVAIENFKKADYTLLETDDNSIQNLFKEIITNKPKGNITLNVNFKGTYEDVIIVRVLRTLLAFVSDNIFNNASIIQFQFFGVYNYNEISLNALLFATAAQIDTLTVENNFNWLPLNSLINQTPVDNLYGSSFLENETSETFFRLWKLIGSD